MYKIITKKTLLVASIIWGAVIIFGASLLFLSSSPKAEQYYTEAIKEVDQYQAKMGVCIKEISVDELYGMSNLYSIYDVDKNGEHYEEIEKTFHDKRGTIVDLYGDPIQEYVEMYLDPIPCTGLSENAGRLTFITGDNGEFNLFSEELGGYTLSLQDGWYFTNEMKPVDFRNGNGSYRIVVHNDAYNEIVKKQYTKEVKSGDTLWSISEEYYGKGYYWPVLARDNSLDQEEGIPEIYPGDELLVTPYNSLDTSYLGIMRETFNAGQFNNLITYVNDEHGYSIEYPGYWISDNSDKQAYKIIGPNYRFGKDWVKTYIAIKIYSADGIINLEDFALKYDITMQSVIDHGNFIYEDWKYGGKLITFGAGEKQHLVFFKDNNIYDIYFNYLHDVKRVDPKLSQEILDIIDTFKFIN